MAEDMDWEAIRQKLANGGQANYSPLPDDSDDIPTSQAASPPAPSDDDDSDSSSSINPVLQQHLSDLAQLRQAQGQAKDNQFGAGLTGALAQITHGLSHAQGSADMSGANALEATANDPVSNVLAQQKLGDEVASSQRDDDIADNLRDVYKPLLKKAGVDASVLDGMGAEEINHYIKNLAEFYDRDQQRREQAAQRSADSQRAFTERSGRMLDADEQKKALASDKMALALKADLDPNGGRAGNMGQNQKRVDAADRLEGLLKQTGGNPDQRQMEELAIGAQNMLSNGNGSAEQVKSLVPSSAWGDSKKLYEWFSNNPTGTDQQAFVSRMGDTIAREKQIAGDQVKTAQVQRLAAHQALKQQNPDVYGSVLQSYGIDPANIKNNRYESPAMSGGGFHPDASAALQWAKNNPNDPRSKKILDRLGAANQGAPL